MEIKTGVNPDRSLLKNNEDEEERKPQICVLSEELSDILSEAAMILSMKIK